MDDNVVKGNPAKWSGVLLAVSFGLLTACGTQQVRPESESRVQDGNEIVSSNMQVAETSENAVEPAERSMPSTPPDQAVSVDASEESGRAAEGRTTGTIPAEKTASSQKKQKRQIKLKQQVQPTDTAGMGLASKATSERVSSVADSTLPPTVPSATTMSASRANSPEREVTLPVGPTSRDSRGQDETETTKVAESTVPPVEFTPDDLPLSLWNGWVLDRQPSPLANDSVACQLFRVKKAQPDGYDATDVTLYLSPRGIRIHSTSNLDLTYPGTGIGLTSDEGENRVPFSGQLDAHGAFLDLSVENIPATLTAINLYLGFWPTWPVTETQEIVFETPSFERLRQVLMTCSEN